MDIGFWGEGGILCEGLGNIVVGMVDILIFLLVERGSS